MTLVYLWHPELAELDVLGQNMGKTALSLRNRDIFCYIIQVTFVMYTAFVMYHNNSYIYTTWYPITKTRLKSKEAEYMLCNRRMDKRMGKKLPEMAVSTKNVLMLIFMMRTTRAKSGCGFKLQMTLLFQSFLFSFSCWEITNWIKKSSHKEKYIEHGSNVGFHLTFLEPSFFCFVIHLEYLWLFHNSLSF